MKKAIKKNAVKKKSILERAKPLSEMSLVITALFYGRTGTGKTTLAGTFPTPLLLLDVGERGTDSLDREGISSIPISSWDEFEEVYWELKDGKHNYRTVVVDSEHALQGLAIEKIKSNNKKDRDDLTSQRDFGQAGALLTQWNYAYRDLRDQGINVVFLAHDRVFEFETEEDEAQAITPEVGAKLMPAVSSSLMGMVNVVGNTFIREEVTKPKRAGEKKTREMQYCLRVGPHSYYSTKIRKPKGITVPEFIVDPSYDKLVNVIQGKPITPTKRKLTRK